MACPADDDVRARDVPMRGDDDVDGIPPALHPHTIAHYIVGAVPTGCPGDRAADVRERLARQKFDDASHVFVIARDDRLAGVVEVGDLLSAPAATPLALLTRGASPHSIAIGTDCEEAASAAIRAGVSVLGVEDREGRFIGAVPATAIISILRDEHLEDLHHMAGILSRSEAAKAALTAPPYQRALFRLPWLVVGMAGSAIATAMMAHFEAALTAHIAVAFFVPAIVYLADAVGTQSEVITVRGLSLMEGGIAPLLASELGTTVLTGTVLGMLAYPLVWFVFGNAALAATVAISLAVASFLATVVGIVLPWAFARAGFDPALASGPIATVFQDVISLVTYFMVASALVF